MAEKLSQRKRKRSDKDEDMALFRRVRIKTSQTSLVRFEMPFPIWCANCPKPTIIGQGIRFNAEKRKVGNYNSSPIYSFRMNHVACGGGIEIRTDPQNTTYIVTEGARKRALEYVEGGGDPGRTEMEYEYEDDEEGSEEGEYDEDTEEELTERPRPFGPGPPPPSSSQPTANGIAAAVNGIKH
jgi:hypothetical protein